MIKPSYMYVRQRSNYEEDLFYDVLVDNKHSMCICTKWNGKR